MDTQLPDLRHSDNGAWAEMLADVSDRNARLDHLVAKRWPARQGTAILAELEQERSRIARELHAGAGQPLAGIKLHLEMLDDYSRSLPDNARATLGRLRTLADQALGQVRAVSHRLHPPAWQELTTIDAIRFLMESSGVSARMRVTEDIGPLSEEPDHNVKVQIYRCAQECISNIVRHSTASEVSISLKEQNGNILLTVSDNGQGFDTSSRTPGIGLRAIAENAASLGGNSCITSSSEGTKISVSFPIRQEPE